MSIKQSKPHDWREARRLQALKLKKKNYSQHQIAEALGVTDGAVSQWFSREAEGGETALLHRDPPGAKPKLSSDQLQRLPALLARGAEAYGFADPVWTRARVA